MMFSSFLNEAGKGWRVRTGNECRPVICRRPTALKAYQSSIVYTKHAPLSSFGERAQSCLGNEAALAYFREGMPAAVGDTP